jgi:hypothetical protein
VEVYRYGSVTIFARKLILAEGERLSIVIPSVIVGTGFAGLMEWRVLARHHLKLPVRRVRRLSRQPSPRFSR